MMPKTGRVFISVREADKKRGAVVAKQLVEQGFTIVATRGTAQCFTELRSAL